MTALEYFESRLEFPLDEFQRTACRQLEDGRSVLVAAPTGSGKTVVAEFAVMLARRERDARVFYTTPIKALSNQKFQELCDEYGEDEVGLLTGDVNVRGDAPVVVMTTEVLRNMIYADSEALADLAFVVLDEVHFLGDKFRGAVWEEIILHLPEHVRIVALSATVSNAEEFGDWMHTVRGDTDVILAEHRPVPLYQHVLTAKALLPLIVDGEGDLAVHGRINPELRRLDGGAGGRGSGDRGDDRRGGRANRGRGGRSRGGPPQRRRAPRISRADIARGLEETGLLPAIVFVFSRNGCDQAVRQCLFSGVRLTTQEERREIRAVVDRELAGMRDEDLRVLGVSEWVAGLEHGVAAHHAGMLPVFKTVVEHLFQRRLIKLVFATETLALGINMPAKAVVIERLDKFNGEQRVPLSSGEFTQLTGRAGRRGIDPEGHAVVVWSDAVDLEALAQLASTRSFPVWSSFRPTANMAVNLLERMDLATARETLELSFAQFQADRAVVDEAHELRAEQESLAGYEAAVERAHGADRKRWEDRTRKLKRRIERRRRQIASRTGTVARTFEHVVDELTELDYLAVQGSGERARVTVQPWGTVLRRIYGDRDLLIAECVRRDVWAGIDAAGLAALCCALTYEPRRDDDGDPRLPGGAFPRVFDATLDVWVETDDLAESHRLPQTEPPHPGLALAMHAWATGSTLERVLEISWASAGDFVRWTKQTIDLLDQLAQASEAGAAAELDVDRLRALAKLARDAKRLVLRGIVEASSGS